MLPILSSSYQCHFLQSSSMLLARSPVEANSEVAQLENTDLQSASQQLLPCNLTTFGFLWFYFWWSFLGRIIFWQQQQVRPANKTGLVHQKDPKSPLSWPHKSNVLPAARVQPKIWEASYIQVEFLFPLGGLVPVQLTVARKWTCAAMRSEMSLLCLLWPAL